MVKQKEILSAKRGQELELPSSPPPTKETKKAVPEKAKTKSPERKSTFLQELANVDFCVFLNEKMVPQVIIPGDGEEPAWDIDSERVRVWLFWFGLNWWGQAPTTGDVRTAVEWLKSEAYRVGVLLPDPESEDGACIGSARTGTLPSRE